MDHSVYLIPDLQVAFYCFLLSPSNEASPYTHKTTYKLQGKEENDFKLKYLEEIILMFTKER
jgi:hypothetical protein